MDSSDIEDRDDQCSRVPEYLRTKTAGLGLVKDALERIFRVKGDSENVGEMEDMPTETYQSLHPRGTLDADCPQSATRIVVC